MHLTSKLPYEKQFFVQNGPVLESAEALKDALENDQITKESFLFHLERKDFQKWIADVYEQKELASALGKVKTPKSYVKKIAEAI